MWAVLQKVWSFIKGESLRELFSKAVFDHKEWATAMGSLVTMSSVVAFLEATILWVIVGTPVVAYYSLKYAEHVERKSAEDKLLMADVPFTIIPPPEIPTPTNVPPTSAIQFGVRFKSLAKFPIYCKVNRALTYLVLPPGYHHLPHGQSQTQYAPSSDKDITFTVRHDELGFGGVDDKAIQFIPHKAPAAMKFGVKFEIAYGKKPSKLKHTMTVNQTGYVHFNNDGVCYMLTDLYNA